MAKKLRVPPTRSALLALRRQVRFLEQGHEMLERKRELLSRVVHERLVLYRKLRREAAVQLESAYRCLAVAQLRMGSHVIRQAGVGVECGLRVEVLARSSVGVEYPSVTATPLPLGPVALMGTDPSFDEARRQLTELAALLATLGEAETALWRLLLEKRKTQKRVNALKYNIIPRYRATIRDIQAALEEDERLTLFQARVLRGREEVSGQV